MLILSIWHGIYMTPLIRHKWSTVQFNIWLKTIFFLSFRLFFDEFLLGWSCGFSEEFVYFDFCVSLLLFFWEVCGLLFVFCFCVLWERGEKEFVYHTGCAQHKESEDGKKKAMQGRNRFLCGMCDLDLRFLTTWAIFI